MRTYPGILSGLTRGYKPNGVAFVAGNSLVNPSLVCTDSRYVYQSFWFQTISSPTFDYAVFGVTDPESNYVNWIALSTNSPIAGQCQFDGELFGPVTGGGFDAIAWNQPTPTVMGVGWHHMLWACDTGRIPTFFKMYVDGNDRTHLRFDAFDPFKAGYNGFPYWIGDDSFNDNTVGNMAEYVLTQGANLFDGAGNIPAATRELFRSAAGKAMPPSGFPGTPTILLSGGAGAFENNQGGGGAFALNGPPLTTVPGPG